MIGSKVVRTGAVSQCSYRAGMRVGHTYTVASQTEFNIKVKGLSAWFRRSYFELKEVDEVNEIIRNRSELNEGDVLIVMKSLGGAWDEGDLMTYKKGKYSELHLVPDRSIPGYNPCFNNYKLRRLAKSSRKPKKEEEQVNKAIIKLFPKTEEAVLVDRHLSSNVNERVGQIIFAGKEKDLLAVAQELEAESKKQQQQWELKL